MGQTGFDFGDNPLVEVAISVEFPPSEGINQAHLGAFWASQKAQFPRPQAMPPIGSSREDFGKNKGGWLPPSLQFQLSNEPALRLQLASSDGQWLCQIQLDRVIVNWRKRTDEYPRFAETLDRFIAVWESWLEFLKSFDAMPVSPHTWEIAYVNRIIKDRPWSEPGQWPKILPGLWGGEFGKIGDDKLIGLTSQWVWEHAKRRARLYVETKPGRFGTPPRDALVLTLTSRGAIESEVNSLASHDSRSGTDQLKAGLNCGHTLINNAFKGIISHDAWNAWHQS